MMKKAGMVRRALCVLAAVVLLAGCGGDDGDYSKYVTLGDYKNLSVELSVPEVTDEEFEEYRKESLSEFMTYHEVSGSRPIQEGQNVELSLLAESDGEVLYDFVEDGYDLVVGSKEFGAEVDEEVIGKKAGDTLNFSVTYGADFEDAQLSGKEVSYQIGIRKVSDIVYPEVTDAFVAENFDEESVESWEQTLRDELASNHQAEATEDMRNELVQKVIDGAKIGGYPKELYMEQKGKLEADYQSYADMFGCGLDEVYEMFGLDEKAREKECEDATSRVMVLELIQKQENITLSDEAFEERLAEFAEYNDYDSVEEMLADYGEEDLKEYFLQEMTLDFLEENADVSIVTAGE